MLLLKGNNVAKLNFSKYITGGHEQCYSNLGYCGLNFKFLFPQGKTPSAKNIVELQAIVEQHTNILFEALANFDEFLSKEKN